MNQRLSKDGRTIIIKIPMMFRRRGGRKTIIAPDGTDHWAAPVPSRDDVLLKALARAHRWQQIMESGQVSSVKELALREEIDNSYVSRILRVNLLAPDIVTAILDGRQPEVLTLTALAQPFPIVWSEQREMWGFTCKQA
jgi:hypothetical protein